MPRTKGNGAARDALAAMRAAQALQLRLIGCTYQEIAERAGYKDRASAYNAIKREINRTVVPPANELRELEVLRLDALLKVFMVKALKGDHWAADRVLAIADRRAKLLGLDAKGDALNLAAQVLIRRYDADVEAV